MKEMNIPWVESPFFNDILVAKNLSEEDKKLAVDYHKNGYVIVPNFFTDDIIDGIRSEMDHKGYNPDFEMKTHRDNVRVMDLWMYSDAVKDLACNSKILKILEMLYDREPLPFQTLNFRVGTQQKTHSDTLHFNCKPEKYMCGVWVALEDITPDNGAVFYYPESQKLPEYNFSHFLPEPMDTSNDNYKEYENFLEEIIRVSNLKKTPFYAKKGDVLIWSSNLLHGGSQVLNKNSTRYSQVTHYYFKGCIYYTPMFSNMVTNEFYLRNHLIDIKTGKNMQQSFNDNKMNYFKTDTEKHLFILNNRLNGIGDERLNLSARILKKMETKIKKILKY